MPFSHYTLVRWIWRERRGERWEPTNDQGILRELLEEALGLAPVHVEVEGIGGHRQAQDGTHGQGGGEP